MSLLLVAVFSLALLLCELPVDMNAYALCDIQAYAHTLGYLPELASP